MSMIYEWRARPAGFEYVKGRAPRVSQRGSRELALHQLDVCVDARSVTGARRFFAPVVLHVRRVPRDQDTPEFRKTLVMLAEARLCQ